MISAAVEDDAKTTEKILIGVFYNFLQDVWYLQSLK